MTKVKIEIRSNVSLGDLRHLLLRDARAEQLQSLISLLGQIVSGNRDGEISVRLEEETPAAQATPAPQAPAAVKSKGHKS